MPGPFKLKQKVMVKLLHSQVLDGEGVVRRLGMPGYYIIGVEVYGQLLDIEIEQNRIVDYNEYWDIIKKGRKT
jgi:hypothetical protein